MSTWAWDPSLSIGIDVIDNQHRRIVDYINELDEAISSNDRNDVSQVLRALADYTVTHFAFEESLMVKGGYPFSDAHRKVHESFARQVSQYQQKFSKGQDISRRLRSDLRIWLTDHIKRDDKDYAPYIKNMQKKGLLAGLRRKFLG